MNQLTGEEKFAILQNTFSQPPITFMKRSFKILTFLLTLCSTATFAQVTFGVKAGFNLANMSLKGEGSEEIEEYKKMLPTFQVGGVA